LILGKLTAAGQAIDQPRLFDGVFGRTSGKNDSPIGADHSTRREMRWPGNCRQTGQNASTSNAFAPRHSVLNRPAKQMRLTALPEPSRACRQRGNLDRSKLMILLGLSSWSPASPDNRILARSHAPRCMPGSGRLGGQQMSIERGRFGAEAAEDYPVDHGPLVEFLADRGERDPRCCFQGITIDAGRERRKCDAADA
jgi:hypothetical protein